MESAASCASTAPGLVEIASGTAGFQAGDAAAEDVAVETCGEEDEPTSERGELVAVASRQAFEEALADEATKVVGHVAHGVRMRHVLLDQGPEVAGVEAAEHRAELAEGAEQSDHARVAEAEPGRALAGLARGHDHVLEEAGGRSQPAALAFHGEQTRLMSRPSSMRPGRFSSFAPMRKS